MFGWTVQRRRLQEFVQSLTLLTDPDDVIHRVGEGLRDLFGPDLVIVLQVEPGRERLVVCYRRGYEADAFGEPTLSAEGKLARWLTSRERCASLSRDLELLEHLDLEEREILTRLRVQYCAPLISLGRLIGMILMGSTDPGWSLPEENEHLLDLLSAEAALAMESSVLHSQQHERIQRLYRAERQAMAGKLAAGVAHEIRNPLTVISSTVEYILRGIPEDDPRRGLTEAVLYEVGRINRTVEGLLSLGRVRETRRIEVDLLKPLEQARLLIEGQAREKVVRVDRHYGRRLVVCGDADQLQQVFLNLLLNALQATEPGGSIAIRAEALEDPPGQTAGGKVQVEIADTGRGIKRTDLDRIFEPFYTTRPEGSGLGLAICQSIVERHEGEIDIRSRPGRGTTVRVCLPLMAIRRSGTS